MPEPENEPDEAPWQRSALVVHRNLPEGVLLFAPGMNAPLAITGPVSSLWGLLDEPRTRLEIAAELARVYGATVERVDSDLASAWDELAASRIIELAAP